MKRTLSIALTVVVLLSFFVSIRLQLTHGTVNSLVGYWKFDGASGNVASDSSGNGNVGTVYGAQWVAGKIGNALKFDGVNDYVSISNSQSLDISGNQISVEFWINMPNGWYADSAKVDQIIFDKGDAYTAAMIANTGCLRFNIPYVMPYPETTKNTWEPNTWYHIASVFDGSHIRIYINGVLDKTATVIGSVSRSTINLAIGSHCYGDKNFFNGAIDEFAIYNYARTAQQISDDYIGQANSNIDFTISNPTVTNNLQVDITSLDDFMKYAFPDSRYCDVVISVSITPSSNVQSVQLKTAGTTYPDVFIMTKEPGDTYSCHIVEADPNVFKDLLWTALTGYWKLPEGVPDLPFNAIWVQPKISSIMVTDTNGQTHEKDINFDLPTAYNILPSLLYSSSTTVAMMCPVDLLVTDSQNRSIGAIYENGALIGNVSGIPGAYYFGDFNSDTVKMFYLPFSEDSYKILGYAFGNGAFNMTVITSSNDQSAANVDFQSGNVVAGDTLSYSLDVAPNGTINLSGQVNPRILTQTPTSIASPQPTQSNDSYIYVAGIIVVIIVIAAIAAVFLRKKK